MAGLWQEPAWLLLLPLAALPWWRGGEAPVRHAALALLPPDAAGRWLAWLLQALASLAIAALVLALSVPSWPGRVVERVGQGAEIVLLVDRSRSMDQGFGRAAGLGSAHVGGEGGHRGQPKGRVARDALADFVAQRPHDRFALVGFSTVPMPVLGFTARAEAVQAAIAAGAVGRGLSDTDIGAAVLAALDEFRDRPFAGARIVLLVSDGGDHLEPSVRERIAERMRREHVVLYWLYLRSAGSPGLLPPPGSDPEDASTVPEVFLHRFFGTLAPQYRAYEVGDPQALQRAVADVGRLADLPMGYEERLPPQPLDGACVAWALGAVLCLLAVQTAVRRRWA